MDAAESRDLEARSDARVLWFAIILVVAVLWVRPMFSSLWLDELLTRWVVGGSFGQAVTRATEFQGQSVAYNAVAWGIARLAGGSEFLLRLPSLLSMALAGVVFFRLVARLIGRDTARLATLAFVTSQGVAFAASDFRPYPFALLAVVFSTFALTRWLDGGGTRWSIGYGVSVGAIVWTQYLFALVLPAHALYWFVRARRGAAKVSKAEVATAGLVGALLLLPAGVQLFELWTRRSQLTIPASPDLETLLAFFVPPVVGGALLIGVLLAEAREPVRFQAIPAKPGTLALLAAWLVIPPTALFMVAAASSLTLLSPRYYISAAPAGAALFGWGVQSLTPPMTRRLIALLLAVFSVVAFGGPNKVGQDWRGAISYANSLAQPGTLVLVRSGPIESQSLSWLEDPARRGYLLAPAAYYPIVGRTSVLPYGVDGEVHPYLNQVLKEVGSTDRFLLISEISASPIDFKPWFEARLASAGWSVSSSASFGQIGVTEFRRHP